MTKITHREVVNMFNGSKGKEIKLKVERGDHIIPNIGESFPVEEEEERKRVAVFKNNNICV